MKIALSIVCLFIVLLLKAQDDTVLHAKDSVIEVKEQDCYASFFEQATKISSPAKIIIITKDKKTTTLASFVKANDLLQMAQYGLSDLDHDNRNELVIWNYTGGAHCCDEFYFFKNTGLNKYQYVAKIVAGNSCINEQKEISYDFYEQFGYFFTCYACAYEDSTETAPEPVHGIVLKYNKGKLLITPGDKELRSVINDNLGKLSELPYQKTDSDADQDDGSRKEFALNLAVFYYSFGKNIAETKKIFDKYYKFPDAKKVWTTFVKTLNQVKTGNDF
jgi:hypothetical protein